MKFWEAMKLLDGGVAVRRKVWAEGTYIEIGKTYPFFACVFAKDKIWVDWWSPIPSDLIANDWTDVIFDKEM